MKLILATNNRHKLEEAKVILSNYPIEVISLEKAKIYEQPLEDGSTYAENATIKVKSAQKFTILPIFADDSGLEIEGLDNAPGIFSKRFTSIYGGQEETNRYLCKIVGNSPATFHCSIALANIKNKIRIFEGEMRGRLSLSPSGTNGFGYDPIFIPDGYDVTYAELSSYEKNKISHRYRAMKEMIKYLKKEGLI
jgi:XTP/dITP diphosphohydrolase